MFTVGTYSSSHRSVELMLFWQNLASHTWTYMHFLTLFNRPISVLAPRAFSSLNPTLFSSQCSTTMPSFRKLKSTKRYSSYKNFTTLRVGRATSSRKTMTSSTATPNTGFMRLPLELREETFLYLLDKEDCDMAYMLLAVDYDIHPFFRLLPREFYLKRQLLDEAFFPFIRHTNLKLLGYCYITFTTLATIDKQVNRALFRNVRCVMISATDTLTSNTCLDFIASCPGLLEVTIDDDISRIIHPYININGILSRSLDLLRPTVHLIAKYDIEEFSRVGGKYGLKFRCEAWLLKDREQDAINAFVDLMNHEIETRGGKVLVEGELMQHSPLCRC